MRSIDLHCLEKALYDSLSRKGMVFPFLQISDITRAAKRVCYRDIAQAKAA